MLKRTESNLLEISQYKYSLQDVENPNLYREIYPYTEIPKVAFNFRRVPLSMPKEIWITDTTFRDGQQSRAPYTPEQIVHLYKLMSKLGGEKGIIRQSEFFVYSKKDREALYKCMELGYKFPEITTWIRSSKSDFELVKNIGIKETGILVSCSDYHIFKKLGMTRRQALEHYLSVVRDALDAGLRPRCHLEDITRADFYGFVVPFVNALSELSDETNIPIKIRMCDTMGYGVPFPGVALPRSVPGIIYGLHHYADVPSEMLEWHGHNDFYKAVANASSAWLYGASAVNCSILGIGERTGNIPLEYFKHEIGYKIPEMTPFVGENFNITRAGIHADGMMKDAEIYNIFDTETILNRPASVSVSNTSGLAGIAFWMNKHFDLSEDQKVSKRDSICEELKAIIDAQYADGRTTVMSDDELEKIVEMIAPGKYKTEF